MPRGELPAARVEVAAPVVVAPKQAEPVPSGDEPSLLR
jgi:hypothetical protein